VKVLQAWKATVFQVSQVSSSGARNMVFSCIIIQFFCCITFLFIWCAWVRPFIIKLFRDINYFNIMVWLITFQKMTGNTYMFKLGALHFLYATNPFMVKEIKLFRSLDLGKPAYLQKDRGVLLGKGVITSNGPAWSHQRKILSPQLYVDKVGLN